MKICYAEDVFKMSPANLHQDQCLLVSFFSKHIYAYKFSQELQNAEIFAATLLELYSTTDTLPAILGILGSLTGNICSGVSFNVVTAGRLNSLYCSKETLLRHFSGKFF